MAALCSSSSLENASRVSAEIFQVTAATAAASSTANGSRIFVRKPILSDLVIE